MKTRIYSPFEDKEEAREVSSNIFGLPENKILIAEAIKVYLANQRQSRAKAKTRAEVSGSGKKIWKQKGTGRARHGDRYAPIFVGGGVTHGPTGKENWHLSLPARKRTKALLVALSGKFKKGELIIAKGFSETKNKTSEAQEMLLKILGKLTDIGKFKTPPKVLLVFEKADLAFRNLPWLKIARARNLNSYDVLNNRFLILSEESLEEMEKKYTKKKDD